MESRIVPRRTADVVVRVIDEDQRFEPDMRVELFQETGRAPGRKLEKSPFGPYRIIRCERVTVHGASCWDVTIRKLRRS